MTTQPPAAGPATGRAGKTGTDDRWAARVVPWVAQVGVAVILAQTLFFKFTYAPETRYIFESRGGQPAATLVGLAELVCVVLLLIPRTAAVGAALALAVIGGAITTHLTSLGVEVRNPDTGEGDGGLLFGLALAVAVGSLVVLGFRWRQLPYVDRLRGRLGVGRAA
ncbi:MAG TPA: hypothetical protein VKE74_26310 [Gemmataceae bacterium]|nr:hypothetical protein [Gemmataceae bacterium]